LVLCSSCATHRTASHAPFTEYLAKGALD
jgi:hypothetical protein